MNTNQENNSPTASLPDFDSPFTCLDVAVLGVAAETDSDAFTSLGFTGWNKIQLS